MINQVDTFVFFDDVDYTSRDWRNRNKVKTKDGVRWLTVPVGKVSRGTKINQVSIPNSSWQQEHFDLIQSSYSASSFYENYQELLSDIYIKSSWNALSEMNIAITKRICGELGVHTTFMNSSELNVDGIKSSRILNICQKLNASTYVTGPAAQNYLDEGTFSEAGIDLCYLQYNYPEYEQLHGNFSHELSVLDVLFHCGPKSPDFIFTQ